MQSLVTLLWGLVDSVCNWGESERIGKFPQGHLISSAWEGWWHEMPDQASEDLRTNIERKP